VSLSVLKVYYAYAADRTASRRTMNYARFERLAIGVGAATILSSVLVSMATTGWSGWLDLLGQLLLLPVLVVAVHFGRKPGLLAALLASAVFIILKIPLLAAPEGIAPKDLAMIAITIGAFGLVGIVGGDICGRIKYFFARYDQSATIDDWSHVYNQRRASELLENARERHSRYGEPFSVVVVSDTPSVLSGLRPTRQRALVRGVASYLSGDVRMIDEVARLDDGRFLVILPHTGREGGLVVAERLVEGVRQTLGAAEDAVSARCLSASEDELELRSLAASISPTSEG
jgi:GGDEF domain-containing protein